MVEFRLWVKLALFSSSYIPLWLAMAIRTWDIRFEIYSVELVWISISFVVVSIISAVMLYYAIVIKTRRSGKFHQIKSYHDRTDLLTSYLIAYIFPFIGLDYTTFSGWLIFGLFIGVLAVIQIRSTHLHVNPILSIFGYRIYEVEGEDLATALLVADRNADLESHLVKTVQLGQNVYITV